MSSGATTERALIEAAGREVARLVADRWPTGPVVGLLGSGHNGADALVALRTLRARGREAVGILCGSSPPEPDVSAGWEVPLRPAEDLEGACLRASVVLDGILGTGVDGAPREPQAEAIRAVDALDVPLVAVDGPSGMDFTTGAVPGACARADLTVALGWPKLGHLRHPARTRCGELVAVEIGFPPPEEGEFGARAVTPRWAAALLPGRRPDAHKGSAGYLSVVAGQAGMAGASVLAARAAGRGGAGIVRVVGDPVNRTAVQAAAPDAVWTDWSDPTGLEAAVEWADALAIGPGLGRGEERRRLVGSVLELRDERPAVLDADALNVWEGRLADLADRVGGGDLLTPHPGELARLLEIDVSEVLDDPPGTALRAARDTGAVVLLKGSPTWIVPPDGVVRVAATAGPEVASGGSGDVLTGLIGALMAGGAGPAGAATAALVLTGVAAEAGPAAEGHLASDVPDRLPAARAALASLPASPPGPVLFGLPAAG